ncbi:MAG TPA: ABC transporter permease [Anaerolineales bacterium]|nr:ABC transporter permease [Anaerolineales bacterium]
MDLSEIINIAWDGITNNKLRSILTMLGVIIGVAAVIMVISISAGTEAKIASQIENLGTNLLFVTQNFSFGGPRNQTNETQNSLYYPDAAAIATIPGVTGTETERNSSQTVQYGGNTVDSVSVVGTTPDFPTVRDSPIGEGRFFTQSDLDQKATICVLGSTLAQNLFGSANPIDQKVVVGIFQMTVVGVLAPRGTVGGQDYDSRIYLPITTVFERYTPSRFARVIGDRINTIVVQVGDASQMDSTVLQIELLLAQRHNLSVDSLPFTVQTQSDVITTQTATTSAFGSLLAWVAAVSLLVGGIGIMNIMLVSVTERTREIGVRQAIGATPFDIRWQFLAEALMLSLTGGLLGVLVGVGGSVVFDVLGTAQTVIVPSSILLAFASAAAVGIFFGYYPANKAAQLDPIDALHYE